MTTHFSFHHRLHHPYLSDVDAENGTVTINLVSPDNLYNQVLNHDESIAYSKWPEYDENKLKEEK